MPGFVAELPTPTRLFTVEQANALLPDILPVVATLREHALALRAEQAVLDVLARRAEEMGGVQPTAREAEAAVARLRAPRRARRGDRRAAARGRARERRRAWPARLPERARRRARRALLALRRARGDPLAPHRRGLRPAPLRVAHSSSESTRHAGRSLGCSPAPRAPMQCLAALSRWTRGKERFGYLYPRAAARLRADRARHRARRGAGARRLGLCRQAHHGRGHQGRLHQRGRSLKARPGIAARRRRRERREGQQGRAGREGRGRRRWQ